MILYDIIQYNIIQYIMIYNASHVVSLRVNCPQEYLERRELFAQRRAEVMQQNNRRPQWGFQEGKHGDFHGIIVITYICIYKASYYIDINNWNILYIYIYK